ncbi:MAG: class B sortase, partial [Butyrivibrio sp.]|nr:class B sortase [Butyrivibrio sp.]
AEISAEAAASVSDSSDEETEESEQIALEEVLPDSLDDGEVAVAPVSTIDIGVEGDISSKEVDWDALTTDNPDTCAYIVIPGTNVDSPVLKKIDSNDYYLCHDAAGAEDTKGSICMDMGNETSFTDPVTCLYANMDEAEPFEELVNYMDVNFLNEHPYIYVYTPDYVTEYKIFAVYNTDDTERLLVKYNFYDYVEYQTYINDIFAIRDMTAVLDENLKSQAIDTWNIISLSGISDDGTRLLVQAAFSGRSETY